MKHGSKQPLNKNTRCIERFQLLQSFTNGLYTMKGTDTSYLKNSASSLHYTVWTNTIMTNMVEVDQSSQ